MDVKDRNGWLFLAALCVTWLVRVSLYHTAAITGPDANSYFAQARWLVAHGDPTFTRGSAIQFVGNHWFPLEGERFACIHPPGLSALLALPYRLLGFAASTWVHIGLAVVSLVALARLGRHHLGDDRWAVLAAVGLALNPIFVQQAQLKFAHMLVLAVVLSSLWALRAAPPTRAFFVGLFAGTLPWIRYVDVLYLPGLLLAAGQTDRRSAGGFAVGALIPTSLLAVYNQATYGAFWKTGYTVVNEQTSFSVTNFLRNLPGVVSFSVTDGLLFFVPLGIIGLIRWCRAAETRRWGWISVALVLPVTIAHIAWHRPPGPDTMRFLLPGFPLYILAAIDWLRDDTRRGARWLLGGLVAITLVWGAISSQRILKRVYIQQQTVAWITNGIEEDVPPGAVLIIGRMFAKNLDAIGSWRLADTSLLNTRVVAAVDPSLRGAPGTRKHTLMPPRDFLNAARTWAGGEREMYWVRASRKRDGLGRVLSAQGARVEEIRCIPLPVAPVRHLIRQPPDANDPDICTYRIHLP